MSEGTGGSGLRNPTAAVRGMGAGMLIMEAVVLLLAIQPIRMLGAGLNGAGMAVICGLALVALALSVALPRGWAWRAGGLLQATVVAAGVVHWSLAVVGVVFGAVWLYVLHVRRTILG